MWGGKKMERLFNGAKWMYCEVNLSAYQSSKALSIFNILSKFYPKTVCEAFLDGARSLSGKLHDTLV